MKKISVAPDHPLDPAILVPARNREIATYPADPLRQHLITTDTMLTKLCEHLAIGERVLFVTVAADGVISGVWPILDISNSNTPGRREFHLARPSTADRSLIGKPGPLLCTCRIEYWDPRDPDQCPECSTPAKVNGSALVNCPEASPE